jgi:hypothetical protein
MEQLSNVIRKTNLMLRIGGQVSAVTGIGMQVAGLLLPEAFFLFNPSLARDRKLTCVAPGQNGGFHRFYGYSAEHVEKTFRLASAISQQVRYRNA